MKKPRCERCHDTNFLKPGDTLCADCARWVKSLNDEARANDREGWGTSPTSRLSQRARKNLEHATDESGGFTRLSDVKVDILT